MRRFLLLCFFLAGMPQVSHAFLEWRDNGNSLELRGLLRGSGITLQNPDNLYYYNDRRISDLAAIGRLLANAGMGENLSLELHATQSYIPVSLQTAGSRFATGLDIERSDVLDWGFDNRQAHFLLDRVNIQYASEQITLKLGRQPINLARTFYFTPNDFFAPFAAQAFFRSYKPGVDAVRAEVQLGNLSQLSLIGVSGYQLNAASDSGWRNRPDYARASYLARASTVFGDFEWGLLGGVVRKDKILGGDFQGELFDWLGVRGEGHAAFPAGNQQSDVAEFSLGLEHRWESSLTLRVEQFYHGSGAGSQSGYATTFSLGSAQVSYLARHYTALGASYEFTPLLNADMTAIHNWVDDSSLLAFYAVYSLSDESELALNANIPLGRKSSGQVIRSEFGLSPYSFNIEVRIYF